MTPPKIPTRQLGRDGPHIPAIGMGLMGMSVGYGQAAYVSSNESQGIIRLIEISDLMKTVLHFSTERGN